MLNKDKNCKREKYCNRFEFELLTFQSGLKKTVFNRD